jgi:hypothetical protein
MPVGRALFATWIVFAPLRGDAQLVPRPAGVSVPVLSATQATGAASSVSPVPAANPDTAVGHAGKIHIGPLSIPRRDSSWWVPLASAAVPGSGQALLGQDRFIAYLALELFAVLGYLDQHAAVFRATDRYEALAGNVARSLYPGPYPVGNWAYYESMEHFIESGVFNLVPGGTFTPEVDVTTYNGAAWLLARQTYWADPNVQPDPSSAEYRKSIAFYIGRAIQPQYRFSWRNAQLEQNVYVQTIEQRNQAARDARLQLGILVANHVLSMVDAYVTLRVHGGLGATGSPTSLSATIPWAPFGRPSRQ